MSDLMGRRYGMRGRIWVVFIGLALGGERLGLLSNLILFLTRGQLALVASEASFLGKPAACNTVVSKLVR